MIYLNSLGAIYFWARIRHQKLKTTQSAKFEKLLTKIIKKGVVITPKFEFLKIKENYENELDIFEFQKIEEASKNKIKPTQEELGII